MLEKEAKWSKNAFFYLLKKLLKIVQTLRLFFLLTHKVIFLKNDIKVIMLQTILLFI
jgi:hypothetical protein